MELAAFCEVSACSNLKCRAAETESYAGGHTCRPTFPRLGIRALRQRKETAWMGCFAPILDFAQWLNSPENRSLTKDCNGDLT